MSLSQLLDEAFRLYRQHFVTFFGIALIMALPGLILTGTILSLQVDVLGNIVALAEEAQVNPDVIEERLSDPLTLRPLLGDVVRLGLLLLGIFLVDKFLFRTLAIGATTAAVAAAYAGRPPTLSSAFNEAFRFTGTLLLWGGLLGGLTLAPLVLLLVGASAGSAALLCVLGLLLFWPVGVLVLLARVLFGARVIVAEGLGVGAAWRRSMDLTRGVAWRVFGLAATLVVVGMVFDRIAGTVVSALSPAQAIDISTASLALAAVLAVVVSALSAPLAYIGITLLYFDQRRLFEAGLR